MNTSIDQDHPKQKLLFFVEGNIDVAAREKLRIFVRSLAHSRDWLIDSPQYVEQIEDILVTTSGDQPIETVGGYIELYSAYPPWKLPKEIDVIQFKEVEFLLSGLAEFSREHALVFELELDGKSVGAVEYGTMDKLLTVGLIEEWRKILGL